jgi:NADH:ubiquinone reductase (H+-translocating)
MKERTRKRVVILGGGFGGVYTAQYLEKALGKRDDFEIILVSKENYLVFQPMLAEVISGSIGIMDAVSPIRQLLPRTDLHVREIESIDLKNKTIITSPGFRPHAHVIPFDYLVIALGTVTDFRGMRGLPEHAIPFKYLWDALYLRNHVIRALEEAAIEESDRELRKQLLTFVIAGGGFSGVEVAAELNDFVRRVARSYRIDPAELKVVLLHSGDRIMPEVSEKLGLFAQKILQKRGVDIRLGTRLEAATGESALLSSGEKIPTKTLVSTVPSSPHPIIESIDLPKGKNSRLITNTHLEVQGAENIWALGDCAFVPTLSDGSIAPPTAQHAIRQAAVVAHNIVASIRGGERKAFDFKGLGMMGALGHRSAVADILGIHISGFLAWFLWRTIYLMKMPGWGRRLKVASSWTLDLLLPAEIVQLRLNLSPGITQEHFEPGQEVFHQGDLGDRIYIILDGKVEIAREEGGSEIVLSMLGPSDFFGEMALLNQTTRGATVRCITPMNVLSIPKREFGMLVATLPELKQKFELSTRQRAQATEQVLSQSAVIKIDNSPGINAKEE